MHDTPINVAALIADKSPLEMLGLWSSLTFINDNLISAAVEQTDAWDEDFGEPCGPLSITWAQLNERLHAMEPDSVEAATAIYRAWQQDEALGFGDSWDGDRVRRARDLALPELPLSR